MSVDLFVQPSFYGPVLISYAVVALLSWLTWQLVWPVWKRYGKLLFSFVAVAVSAYFFGWWTLAFVLAHQLIGLVGHIIWCRKYDFDWQNVDPVAYQSSQQQFYDRLGAKKS